MQVVKDEDEPDAKKLGIKNDGQLQIKEILEREKRGNRVFFKIRWLGFKDKEDETWVARAELMKGDSAASVKEYEKKHKS